METYATSGQIVVGVDGSTHAHDAVDWAADQAALEDRPLLLVTAIGTMGTPGTVWLASTGVDPSPVLESMRVEAQDLLDDATARALGRHPDLRVECSVEDLDPQRALLRHADRATMLVVGSRGHGPLRSRLLGSVSLGLAEHAPCPVVVVRPHAKGKVRRGVLVGVDGTASAQPVLEQAFRLASARRLPLTALLARWDYTAQVSAATIVVEQEDRLGNEDMAWLALAQCTGGLGEKFPDVHLDSRVVHGNPANWLVDAGASMDLVVVGRHERHGLRRLLEGSITAAVLERTPSVVVVVPVGLPE